MHRYGSLRIVAVVFIVFAALAAFSCSGGGTAVDRASSGVTPIVDLSITGTPGATLTLKTVVSLTGAVVDDVPVDALPDTAGKLHFDYRLQGDLAWISVATNRTLAQGSAGVPFDTAGLTPDATYEVRAHFVPAGGLKKNGVAYTSAFSGIETFTMPPPPVYDPCDDFLVTWHGDGTATATFTNGGGTSFYTISVNAGNGNAVTEVTGSTTGTDETWGGNWDHTNGSQRNTATLGGTLATGQGITLEFTAQPNSVVVLKDADGNTISCS